MPSPRAPAVTIFLLATIATADDRGPGDGPTVAALVADLRADDEDRNAIRATRALQRLPRPPINELSAALDSDDWQQRQIAASLLWRFLEPRLEQARPPLARPTSRLIEVTIEGLKRDELPYDEGRSRYTPIYNAASGFRRLVNHAHEARPLLESALESNDAQQRFLCALALGFGQVRASAPLAAPILIPHLRDNEIPEDAKWAVHALHGFGTEVLPLLASALPTADAQQRDLIELLVKDILDPPRSNEQHDERRHLNAVTTSVRDPAIQPPRDYSMGWLRHLPR